VQVEKGGGLPKQSKITDDWGKERKKQKVLSLILIAIIAVVVILFIIALLRGRLR
jgi:uncharacterized membrane protein YvbJ